MCNIRLQAPTLARKCDISHWFLCGADGLADGQLLILDRLTNFLSCGELRSHALRARVEHRYNCLKLKGIYPFADIDECTTNIHSCDVNASCNNTIGSHNCTCNSGFYGSGQECLGKINC